ncbi:MAG: hypothetical protein ACLVAK_03050 [Clostridia bacterium]|jgi:hypothetical protein
MNEFLNSKLVQDLRDVINKTDIFIKDPIEKEKFNLICAIMDRFDSSINFLNENQTFPKSENDFINFLVHVSIIRDGINNVFEVLRLEIKNDNKIFEQYYKRDLPNINKEINDDKFYEYFRSLAFAHPFVTNRSIPNVIDKTEIQYSPYVLTNLGYLWKDKNAVGIEVYSNRRNSFSISFPFEKLKEYVKWKYEMIVDIISEFEKIINRKEKIWREHKVKKNLSDIETLKDIKIILEERCINIDEINELMAYLTCECSLKENYESVEKFKNAIKDVIPKICNAIDNYKHEEVYDVVRDILYPRPKAHQMMYYQIEKIYSCLNDDYGDVEWGLIQAEAFANEFAKKWVTINPRSMNFDEIKLLTGVACYLEYKEQMGVKI